MWNWKLKTRLSVYVSALIVGALSASAVVIALQVRSAMRDTVQAALVTEVSEFEDKVFNALMERDLNVQTWAEDAIIRGALLYDSYEKSDEALRSRLDRNSAFETLVLFRTDGTAVSASGPDVLALYDGKAERVREASWFKRATTGGGKFDLTVGVDPLLKHEVLILAAPVLRGDDHQLLGVLLGAFDWSYLNDLVKPTLERAKQTDRGSLALYVLDDQGNPLFSTSELPQELQRSLGTRVATQASYSGDLADAVVALTGAKGQHGMTPGWQFMAAESQDQAYAVVTRVMGTVTLLIILFSALGVFVSLLLARSIVRPILMLRDVVAHIVKEGDLTKTVPVSSKDEVGELAAAFSQMVTHLRDMNLNLQSSVDLLKKAAGELNAQTAEQSAMIVRQAAALQETQVTAQEIKQTSLLASQKAELVLQVAHKADEFTRSGEHAVAQSVGGMEDIRLQVSQLAQNIGQLSERTVQIGTITQTVKDLADQSNMLALNAAIEAVRSGEHGKGFGVVAREIRTLADQSIKATDRVREILDDINGSVRNAVQISEKGSQRMDAGMQQIQTSGQSLKELANIVSESSAAVRQIASAVSQQNAGIAQIFTAITDLSKMMDETVSRVDSIGRATTLLQDASTRMTAVASAYRVS